MGGAQSAAREQAMDPPEADDHPPQSGHGYHQSMATERWRLIVSCCKIQRHLHSQLTHSGFLSAQRPAKGGSLLLHFFYREKIK